jgi:hypothetical protein
MQQRPPQQLCVTAACCMLPQHLHTAKHQHVPHMASAAAAPLRACLACTVCTVLGMRCPIAWQHLHQPHSVICQPTRACCCPWPAVRSREELEEQYICFERCSMAGKDFIVAHSTPPRCEELQVAEAPADDSKAVSSCSGRRVCAHASRYTT